METVILLGKSHTQLIGKYNAILSVQFSLFNKLKNATDAC